MTRAESEAKRGRGTLTFDGAYTLELYPLIINEAKQKYVVLSADFVRGKGTDSARVLGQQGNQERKGVELNGQVQNLDFVNARIQAKIHSNDSDEVHLLPLFTSRALPEGAISGLSYSCLPTAEAPGR